MGEPISGSYLHTKADHLGAVVAQNRYGYAMISPVLRVAVWLYLGFAFATLLLPPLTLPKREPSEVTSVLIIIEVALVIDTWLIVYLATPRNILNRIHYGREFRAIPEDLLRVEWGCDPDGLWNQTSLGSGSFRWETFGKIVETPECFLFYQERPVLLKTSRGLVPPKALYFSLSHRSREQAVLFLPGPAFSSPGDLRRFADLARSRVANYVVLGECRFPAKPEPVSLDEL